MAKKLSTNVPDAAANFVKNASTKYILHEGEAANFVDANTTNLANLTITSANFTGPAAGDGGGDSRKITVNAANFTISANGTANHAVLLDTTNSVIIAQTTFTNQTVTANNTANVTAWDIEWGTAT